MENKERQRLAVSAIAGTPPPAHLGFADWNTKKGVQWLAQELEAVCDEAASSEKLGDDLEAVREELRGAENKIDEMSKDRAVRKGLNVHD